MSQNDPMIAEELPGTVRGSARSYLLTVLGELVMPDTGTAWTSQLLAVLGDLGIGVQAGRQAIARAAASDWIEAERVGREVRWTLTDRCRSMLVRGEQRVADLADPEPWDHRWLVAFLTIPAPRHDVRKKVYAGLRRRGFGNPATGVWLTPHTSRRDDLSDQLARYGLDDCAYVYTGMAAGVGVGEADVVTRAWPLDELAAVYRDLLRRFDSGAGEPDSVSLTGHLRLVNAWQHMPLQDPRLPRELLPDWIGRDATRTFERLRARGAPAARDAWRALGA